VIGSKLRRYVEGTSRNRYFFDQPGLNPAARL
jgi:hypothetical protein